MLGSIKPRESQSIAPSPHGVVRGGEVRRDRVRGEEGRRDQVCGEEDHRGQDHRHGGEAAQA